MDNGVGECIILDLLRFASCFILVSSTITLVFPSFPKVVAEVKEKTIGSSPFEQPARLTFQDSNEMVRCG